MNNLKKLLEAAEQNAFKISNASKSCPSGYFTAFYDGVNGYTAGHIQIGFETQEKSLGFGSKPLSEDQVLELIRQEKNMLP